MTPGQIHWWIVLVVSVGTSLLVYQLLYFWMTYVFIGSLIMSLYEYTPKKTII